MNPPHEQHVDAQLFLWNMGVSVNGHILGTEKHVLWFELSNRNHDTQLESWYLINLRDWVPVRFVVMRKLWHNCSIKRYVWGVKRTFIPWFTDIGKSFTDIGKWITDIGKWFTDIGKWFTDIGKSSYLPISVNELPISVNRLDLPISVIHLPISVNRFIYRYR